MEQSIKSVADTFNRSIFWDADVSKLDWQKDRHYIITKLFMFADETDCLEITEILKKYYSKRQIYNSIVRSDEYLRLSAKACNLFAKHNNLELTHTPEKIKHAVQSRRTVKRRESSIA